MALLCFGCGLLGLLLLGRGHEADGNWEAQLKNVIDEDLDVIRSGGFKLHLAKKRYVRRIVGRVLQTELHLALAQNGCLVWSDHPNGFDKLADASRPAIEDAELECDNRKLGHINKTNYANENEIAIGFLADIFANKGGLEIGKDTGSLHLVSII
jgi:hypothetical protein